MNILLTWAALSLGMFLSSQLLARMEIRGGIGGHLIVGAGFGIVLALTGWAIHLALGLMTFGLTWVFGFVGQVLVGAIVLKITDLMSERLKVDGIGTALVASLILTVTANVVYALA